MNKWFLIIFLVLACKANAFEIKGIKPQWNFNDSLVKSEKKHSPHRATIYSAILPGLGQAYNKKYWKIPIIFAALGISGYYIHRNRDSMIQRQNALKAMLDEDSTTMPDAKYKDFPIDVLRAQRNFYRTYRDYSIIAVVGFYFINIIDAAVDAHFYNFNIDKSLSERKVKKWNIYSSRINTTPTIGFSWRF